MSGVVADTHAIVWYLARDPRLSATAFQALRSVTAIGGMIYVPLDLSGGGDVFG